MDGRYPENLDRERTPRQTIRTKSARSLDRNVSGPFAFTFEHQVLPQRPLLYRHALRLTSSRDEAEDLVQETLVRAFRGFSAFQGSTGVNAWLCTILRNCFISGCRTRARAPRNVSLDVLENASFRFPREEGPERRVLSELEYEAVCAVVAALPANLRHVLVLADFDGLMYREVSERLRIPLGTVRSRLFRARIQVRRAVEAAAERPDLSPRTGRTLRS